MEHPARACLAEIIVTTGDGPTSRGSGYLVASGWMLTAAHVVDDVTGVGVWLGSPAELREVDGYAVDPARVHTIPGVDLALLPIPDGATPAGFVRPLLGALNRVDAVGVGAVAVGFPRFKLREDPSRPEVMLREVQYATGRIVGGSNVRTGTLALHTTDAPAPHPDPDRSPWEGMSGAPVFVSGRLVGVVGQHHPSEGTDALTVRPLRLPDDAAAALSLGPDPVRAAWADALPQLVEPLPEITPPTVRELAAKRAHAAARRLLPEDGVLIAREAALADLAAFAVGGAQWRWIRAEPFAGKTALLAYFALHPPEVVDVVACFLRTTTGENTAAHALKVLDEQLAGVLGRPSYLAPATLPDLLFDLHDDLLPGAAQAARQTGRHLLLLADGLDEYAPTEQFALGKWLPTAATLPDGVNVLVASRAGVDVYLPDRHPLTTPTAQKVLTASEVATRIRHFAQDELEAAFHDGVSDPLKYAIAGCLAATGGGISTADLNTWLIRRGTRTLADSLEYLTDQIRAWFHRSIRTADDPTQPDGQILVFAHETLAGAFEKKFTASLPGLRDELHTWAEEHQEAGWPADTPSYLLFGYPRLLTILRDVERLTALAVDAARHDRLRATTGADTAALQEIRTCHQLQLDLPEVDLLSLGRLTRHRTRLEDRANNVPAGLPAVWALLGHTNRAIATSTSITKPRPRASALIQLVEALGDAGEHVQARVVADQARGAIETIDDTFDRSEALTSLVEALATAGEYARACQVAATIPNPDTYEYGALTSLVGALATAGEYARACQVAATIPDDYYRSEALTSLVGALATAGEYERARQVAATIPDDYYRSEALIPLVGALATAGEYERAPEVAATIHNPASRAQALTGLVEALTAAGEHEQARVVADQARRVTETIENPDYRSEALIPLVWALATTGEHEQARQVAATIHNPAHRAQALTGLVEALAAVGEHEQALQVSAQASQVAATVTDTDTQLKTWTGLFEALAAVGEHEQALQVATQASQVAATIHDPTHRAQALTGLVEALAAAGEHEQALQVTAQASQVAATITYPHYRARALTQLTIELTRLARALATTGERDQASDVAEQAHEVAETITIPWMKVETLARLAGALVTAGAHNQASQVAERARQLISIGTDLDSAQLYALVRELADAGAHAQARQIAKIMTDHREGALKLLADSLTAAGEHAQALEVAEAITDHEALTSLARRMAAAGASAQARQVAERARRVAETITDPDDRELALVRVAVALAGAGEHAQARQVTETITEPIHRSKALTDLSEALALEGDLERARWVAERACLVAETITDRYEREFRLKDVAVALARAGAPAPARQVAETITERSYRWQALTGLVWALAGAGKHAQARQVTEDITEPALQSALLASLAEALAHAGEHAQARQVAEAITDHEALTRLALTLAAAGAHAQARQVATQARQIAETITDPDDRELALAHVAVALAGAGEHEEARQFTETIPDRHRRDSALRDVARALADAGEQEQARQVAETITDHLSRGLALKDVARALADVGEHEQARQVAETITGPKDRARSLADLAEMLATASEHVRAREITDAIADPARARQALTRLPHALIDDGHAQTAKRVLGSAWLTQSWLDSPEVLAACDPEALKELAFEEIH